MPLKTLKKDVADALILEWILQLKHYKLTLNKERCVGCQICRLACPKGAIKLKKQPKAQNGKAKKAKVDIDLAKCNFCGICDVSCPYGAVKLTLNDKRNLLLLQKGSYPELIRDIRVDTAHCPKDCNECETVCPLGLIKVTRVNFEGDNVKNVAALSPSQQERLQVNLKIQKEYCPTCRVCEFKCAPGVIKVRKFIEGKIDINQAKCPKGCRDCLDVCPITGALYSSETGDKVHVNQLFCVYCGACKTVCPVDDALTLKRTKILHTPVHSGAWNKALQRLTSPVDAVKELKAASSRKLREQVSRRFIKKEKN